MASSTADLRTAMESTLAEFIKSNELAFKNKDVSSLSATLTEDCKRHLRPASFIAAYPFVKAVETNAEYEARMGPEVQGVEDITTKVLESLIDPVKRQANAHTESTIKIAGGRAVAMEICWYLDFTEDGKKISRIVEFIDTAASAKMIEAMMGHGNEGQHAS